MINKAFAYLNNNIEETNSFLKITINQNEFDLNNIDFKTIFYFINKIPDRDKYELSLEIDGTVKSITNQKDKKILIDHLDYYKSQNENVACILILEIKKSLHNQRLSIYSLNSFLHFLEEKKLKECIEVFSNLLKDNIIFDVFDENLEFDLYTNSIAFVRNNKENSHEFENLKKKEKIQLLNDNKIISNIQFDNVLASDFHLVSGSNEGIEQLFKKIKSLLSLSSIVNTFNLNHDGSIDIKINGYKTITNHIESLDFLNNKNELLFKIYEWAYEGGNGSDKIGLIRNVLSLHLDSNDYIKIDSEVWDAIRSNYQIYLKENIQSYLEVKNKIGEFILELSSKTYAMADEILNSFKNNVLLLLTFIISVVIVNGIKDNGIEKIFSLEYIYVIAFLSLISIFWFWLLQHEIIKRFDKATSNIKSILIRNYRQIIMKSEIDNTLKPIVFKNRKYLRFQIKVFWKYLIIIIFVVNLFFIIGYFFHKNKQSINFTTNQTISKLLNDENKYINQLNTLNYEILKRLGNEVKQLKFANDKLFNERNNYHDKLEKLEKENLKLQDIYRYNCDANQTKLEK